MIKVKRKRSFSPSVEDLEPKQLLSATMSVTNLSNDVDVQGSLRWAIRMSNQIPSTIQSPNAIKFAPSVQGHVIHDNTTPMQITSDVNIISSPGRVAISGDGVSQLFVTSGSDTAVNFGNLNLVHGRANGDASHGNGVSGGAVLASGYAVGFYGCQFSDDTAAYSGGAIYAHTGTVVLNSCQFDHNGAYYYGGAIACNPAVPLVITGGPTSFISNYAGAYGGAIQVQSGYLLILGSQANYNSNYPNNVYSY